MTPLADSIYVLFCIMFNCVALFFMSLFYCILFCISFTMVSTLHGTSVSFVLDIVHLGILCIMLCV